MESTANLNLPYIMPQQAQKHLTHNEALAMLDAVVQLAILDRGLTAPPDDPAEGDRYIPASGATGAWSGHDDEIALFLDGGWRFIAPGHGFTAWAISEDTALHWDGSAWVAVSPTLSAPQNLDLLGVGTTADASSPFAAKLNQALWTARYASEDGNGDLRYTLNKESAGGTLSVLLQSDWSGRAEIGLIGNDDLTMKVSTDGSAWKEAIRIDGASGAATFPFTPALNGLAGLSGASGAFVRFTGADTAAMQSILGPVSQAGGVPTGALIERGSNANGVYARFADGTQICSKRITGLGPITITMDALFRSALVNGGNYAAAFAATPFVTATLFKGSAGLGGWVTVANGEPSSSAFGNLYYPTMSRSSADTDFVLHLTATGRWF